MRKLLIAVAFLICTARAKAVNCPVAANASQATFVSVVNSCGSGNTVTPAAGTTTITSTLNWPCGVSLVGPTPISVGGTQPFYSQTKNETFTLKSTMGIENWGIILPTNCNTNMTFQYIEWNGGDPTNGTVFISTNNESPAGAYAGNLNPQCTSGQCGCLLQHAQNGQNWNPNNSNGVPATATSGGGYVSCGNGGGNFMYMPAGTENVTVINDFIHGNNCGFLCGDRHASLIYMESPGGQSGCCNYPGGYGVTSNITIQWDNFGTSGDCAQANVWSYNQNTEGGGGTCNGVSSQAGSTNLVVSNDRFTAGDDELKYYELATNGANGSAGFCSPCTFNNNHLEQFDRIGEEMQINWGGPNEATLVYSQYSDYSNHLNPMQQDYDISMANGCQFYFNGVNTMTYCVNHVDYNLSVGDGGAVGAGIPGYEYWGGVGGTGNGNFWTGPKMYVSFQYDPSGQFTFNNNTMWTNNSNCSQNVCGLSCNQKNGAPSSTPSCTGSNDSTSNGSITSVQPVLTASGDVVTIHNTNTSTPNGSNPGRDSNTTFWCTSDGSTPIAGGAAASSGNTSIAYWNGGSVAGSTPSQTSAVVTLVGSGTFKCLGMWGAPNQPYSYASGLGYTPSAVASIAYSGTPTTALPIMSPTSENFYPGPLSVTITDSSPSPTIYYTTNGTPPTTGSTVYTGALSISVTTTVQAIATSSGLATSPIASNTYTLFNNIPVLSTCYQGNSCSPNNQLVVPNTCQQVTQCQYPSGTSPQACNTPDGNGSYVSTWGTSNSAIVTVNSSGLVQSVSAGTANTLSTVYQPSTNTSTPCFQWTWTVTGGTTPGTFGKPVGLRNPWIR